MVFLQTIRNTKGFFCIQILDITRPEWNDRAVEAETAVVNLDFITHKIILQTRDEEKGIAFDIVTFGTNSLYLGTDFIMF